MGKLRSWSSNNEKKTIYFDSLCIFSFVVFVVAAAAAVTFTCINDNEVIVSENMSKHLSFHWTVSCVCKRFFLLCSLFFRSLYSIERAIFTSHTVYRQLVSTSTSKTPTIKNQKLKNCDILCPVFKRVQTWNKLKRQTI